jgi:diaminopimelate epimerase
MIIPFCKFQGTGNDFILIDNRSNEFSYLKSEAIKQMCHRRFGIGADGLMLLENVDGYDFRMVYFNSDGNQSTMCGNGGRCIAAFAQLLEPTKSKFNFIAIDGGHTAIVNSFDGKNKWFISLSMNDVHKVNCKNENYELNTGSPHLVSFVNNVDELDVVKNGRQIRNSETYLKEGINVNFVEIINDHLIKTRTYERGVEDETLSCGTGVTASAIAFAEKEVSEPGWVKVLTPGGELDVSFVKKSGIYSSVILKGPAELVFKGKFFL